jgi:hypothetical protein
MRLQFKTDRGGGHRCRINTDLPALVPEEGLVTQAALGAAREFAPADVANSGGSRWLPKYRAEGASRDPLCSVP